ncbi:hypothetical protein HaLaN_19179 [Haematococcus lacustris]|uniref:Uncharacterized protein n=1 Tax=Haematococcus lacustris TaxID=44745 RepID=A0A699ZQ63_HAELA|nr:hypothetical protein HaLaN_19179 [Haematococcus lacustris]
MVYTYPFRIGEAAGQRNLPNLSRLPRSIHPGRGHAEPGHAQQPSRCEQQDAELPLHGLHGVVDNDTWKELYGRRQV